MERKTFKLVIENGMLVCKQTSELIDTVKQKVLSGFLFLVLTKTLYVGIKKKGLFQHSSFLSGAPLWLLGELLLRKVFLRFCADREHWSRTKIGCLQDYPSKAAITCIRSLEQAKLPPRSLESFNIRNIHP